MQSIQNRQLLEQSLAVFTKQSKTQSTAVSKQNLLIEAMSVDTAHSDERQGRYDETSNEVRSMLIEVGWKKSPHSPSSVLRGSWRGPLRKDEGFDHGHDQQAADQSQRDVPIHQGDCAMIKQVEIPHVQHSAARTSPRRGLDVAKQLQHSILQINHTSLDMVARQRCAKRARPEHEQVARG